MLPKGRNKTSRKRIQIILELSIGNSNRGGVGWARTQAPRTLAAAALSRRYILLSNAYRNIQLHFFQYVKPAHTLCID